MNPAAPDAPHSLYPELDATALTAFATALESGDTAGLPPARAAEVRAARAAATFSRGKVAGTGGDLLDAALWRHTGPGPRPAVVLPSPWTGLGWTAYAVQATALAARGYDVLAYTVRGFGRSDGHADFAGPLDVADGRRALEHLLERAAGPVTRIGFLGVSYGAGIGLLVAAHDPRVDAVAALGAWGDLGEVLYENSTRRAAAVQVLLASAGRARLSPETERTLEDVLADRGAEGALRWAQQRSPSAHVKEFNRRRVAVFLSHAWHETVFPANQTLGLFGELTGPKRLDLSVGDHCGPESAGLLGLPSPVWTDAHRWLDHHLCGTANGVEGEAEVLAEVMWSRALEPSADLPAPGGNVRRLYLTGGGGLAGAGGIAGAGRLAPEPEHGWTAGVLCGVDTPAAVADAVVRSGYAELAGRPKPYPGDEIGSATAASVTAAWCGAPAGETLRVRGVPRLRVTYRAANSGSTFVAYLLDLAPDGSARLITHAPFSDLTSPPDSLISADIDLQATAYDVPRGHRLLLVAAARDPFYGDANLPRATLAFTSPEPVPSYLEVPVG